MRTRPVFTVYVLFFLAGVCEASTSGTISSRESWRPSHHVSAEYALLKNVGADGALADYSGLGVRYALVLARHVLFSLYSDREDEFAVELGAFYYSITGFSDINDKASVFPLVATLRYGLDLGRSFTPFVYAGAVKNVSNNESLNRLRAAGGGGLLWHLASTWSLRAEYGSDMFGAGFLFRF